MRVLSIDWDYFVEENPMLDWGHQEVMLFLEEMWKIRRIGIRLNPDKSISSEVKDLTKLVPFRGHESSITNLACLNSPHDVFVAESHLTILQAIKETKNLEIINVDAHHDIHYGKPCCVNTDKEPDCGCWGSHLIHKGQVKSWLQVYPEWRKKYPESYGQQKKYTLEHEVKFDAIYGTVPYKWRKVDMVFVCRSGCWVPPEYDIRFSFFCLRLGIESPLKEREVTIPKLEEVPATTDERR